MARANTLTISTSLRFADDEVNRGIARAMDRAARSSAELLADTAQQIVPVDTGALRRSIRVRRVAPRQYDVGAGEFYAGFVEFGTIKMAAQPYLRPAIAQRSRSTFDLFEREATEVVRRDYL